jgi:hypothetical protein
VKPAHGDTSQRLLFVDPQTAKISAGLVVDLAHFTPRLLLVSPATLVLEALSFRRAGGLRFEAALGRDECFADQLTQPVARTFEILPL